MQVKTMRYHLAPIGMAVTKTRIPLITSADEDAEKLEPWSTAKKQDGTAAVGKQCGSS
jgi:hypothetical protein